jgi:hypothetical protein
MESKRLLIGIDDTDNLESRGTGFLARSLGQGLQAAGLARLIMVVRHQLLVHKDIPYTSHNSSASLLTEASDTERVRQFCREFLLAHAASGSDVGLCVASWDDVGPGVIEWGNRAKREVIRQADALTLAASAGISLEGLTGEHTGVIGSLAAVGLRKEGNDGRVLWMPGLRELAGHKSVESLQIDYHIEDIRMVNGDFVPLHATVELGEWARPVMQAGKATLYIEKENDTTDQYRVAGKDFIKRLSE